MFKIYLLFQFQLNHYHFCQKSRSLLIRIFLFMGPSIILKNKILYINFFHIFFQFFENLASLLNLINQNTFVYIFRIACFLHFKYCFRIHFIFQNFFLLSLHFNSKINMVIYFLHHLNHYCNYSY